MGHHNKNIIYPTLTWFQKMLTKAGVGGSGTLELATQQEAFDINSTKALSPATLYNLMRNQRYDTKNDVSAQAVVLTPTDELNLFSTFLEVNEAYNENIPSVFQNVSDSLQATYLDEANDKYLFPSNLFTFNQVYVESKFRVILIVDHPAVGSNQGTTLKISLNRSIDDSEISAREEKFSNVSARTGFKFTIEFTTFVSGETDPFVLDGMYILIINETDSNTNVTIQGIDIDLFKR